MSFLRNSLPFPLASGYTEERRISSFGKGTHLVSTSSFKQNPLWVLGLMLAFALGIFGIFYLTFEILGTLVAFGGLTALILYVALRGEPKEGFEEDQ